jgi:hypothetical protein
MITDIFRMSAFWSGVYLYIRTIVPLFAPNLPPIFWTATDGFVGMILTVLVAAKVIQGNAERKLRPPK